MQASDSSTNHGTGNFHSLSRQFLIAMPQLQDPFFANSVVYIWEHTEEGALGVAINLPVSIQLSEIFEQMDIRDERPPGSPQTVLSGGPVETDKGFILHDAEGNWDSTMKIDEGIYITTSRDILADIAGNRKPENYLIILGCSGWSPGQLEEEIAANAWLTCPASKDIIFSRDFASKPRHAAASLGVDLSKLTTDVGMA